MCSLSKFRLVEGITRVKKITANFPDSKILLVEDYIINRELTVEMLSLMGCEVEVAVDGQEALDMHAKDSYDCILLDIQIPKIDGFDVTKYIRKQEKKDKTHTPIVALTANALESDRQKCLSVGMDDYLRKPLRAEKLEEALSKFLKK
jgi:CheY-like chemotaxis protein